MSQTITPPDDGPRFEFTETDHGLATSRFETVARTDPREIFDDLEKTRVGHLERIVQHGEPTHEEIMEAVGRGIEMFRDERTSESVPLLEAVYTRSTHGETTICARLRSGESWDERRAKSQMLIAIDEAMRDVADPR